MSVRDALATRLAAGLQRKAVTTCSRWAERYRVMGQPFPGPYSFKYHPWAREMCDCDAEEVVGQKSAQAGFTEVALNRTFFKLDIRGTSCMYLLPAAKPDASDFSSARFDPALELSPHLSQLFSDVSNIGHKRAGSANLYIRGSRSRSQLKSAPVGYMVFDELDEMVQENIPLAIERMSGQLEQQSYYISTPTIPQYGINELFLDSSQSHFFFKCPHCGRHTELVFPDCLVITADDFTDPSVKDSHIICKECRHPLEHKAKHAFLANGHFEPTVLNKTRVGFYVNQLYSSTVHPYQLAVSYLKGLKGPAEEQEFYNSKLGLCHVVKGARVDDEHLNDAYGDYFCQDHDRGRLTTMGVDVGSQLHVVIDEWSINENKLAATNDPSISSNKRTLNAVTVEHFEQLDQLMHDYKINFCVIDANPERRKAKEFADRFYGYVKLCFYGNAVNGKTITEHSDEECTITVDRTSWLDVAQSRFLNRTIKIPQNISKEYKDQIKAITRVYRKNDDGQEIGKWVCGNTEDHFAHANNYSEIALSFALRSLGNFDI